MRSAGTILSCVALLWGFVQAPFLHIHAETEGHPAPSVLHLHAQVPQPAAPAIGAHSPDEDAIGIDWRIASPPSVDFTLHLAVAGTTFVAPPRVVSPAPAIPQPRAHDPPLSAPSQPRSPPA